MCANVLFQVVTVFGVLGGSSTVLLSRALPTGKGRASGTFGKLYGLECLVLPVVLESTTLRLLRESAEVVLHICCTACVGHYQLLYLPVLPVFPSLYVSPAGPGVPKPREGSAGA